MSSTAVLYFRELESPATVNNLPNPIESKLAHLIQAKTWQSLSRAISVSVQLTEFAKLIMTLKIKTMVVAVGFSWAKKSSLTLLETVH